MTMRTASIPTKHWGTADALSCLTDSAFTPAPTGVNGVCQRRNTECLSFGPTPLTNLPVAASEGAVTGLFARPLHDGQKAETSDEPLRPAASALAKRLYAVNGHVMGWHPVIGLPVREARA